MSRHEIWTFFLTWYRRICIISSEGSKVKTDQYQKSAYVDRMQLWSVFRYFTFFFGNFYLGLSQTGSGQPRFTVRQLVNFDKTKIGLTRLAWFCSLVRFSLHWRLIEFCVAFWSSERNFVNFRLKFSSNLDFSALKRLCFIKNKKLPGQNSSTLSILPCPFSGERSSIVSTFLFRLASISEVVSEWSDVNKHLPQIRGQNKKKTSDLEHYCNYCTECSEV